ncbi:MAG TPA: hypothetical protein VGL89_13500 [Candidatus Koribacter sp.]|jgi:hypothetical protein
MKSKIILGVATLLGLALPSFAQQTYCRPDRDGDRQICTTSGYDAYGRYYQHSFSQPVYNGYYGGAYRGNNHEYWRDRDHARHEWREHEEHERHERREHHDRDWR